MAVVHIMRCVKRFAASHELGPVTRATRIRGWKHFNYIFMFSLTPVVPAREPTGTAARAFIWVSPAGEMTKRPNDHPETIAACLSS